MVRFLAFIKHHRYGLTALALLTLAVLIMLSVRVQGGGLGGLRGAFLDVVGSIQRVILSPVEVYRDVRDRASELGNLYEDNRALRAELLRIEPERERLEEMLQENRRLRSLLNMRLDPEYHAITARVIGDSSSAFASSFIIAAGKADHVVKDVPVVAHHGLVGRVVETGEHYCMVLALLDLNSRIPVLVQRSRVRAIAAGTNDRFLRLDFLPKGADVRLGDRIITSGMGGLFPKGLVLGRVVSVEPFGTGLFQKVVVKPAVDFSHLEEVRLLLTVANTPPAAKTEAGP